MTDKPRKKPPREQPEESPESAMLRIMLAHGCDGIFMCRRRPDGRVLVLCDLCGCFHEPRKGGKP